MTVRFEADPEAAAHRAEAWCGEPLLHEGEDPSVALARARSGAPRSTPPSPRWNVGAAGAELRVAARLRARPGPRARPLRAPAEARLRDDAAPPPGRRPGRPAGRPDRRPRAAGVEDDEENGDEERRRRTTSRTTTDETGELDPDEDDEDEDEDEDDEEDEDEDDEDEDDDEDEPESGRPAGGRRSRGGRGRRRGRGAQRRRTAASGSRRRAAATGSSTRPPRARRSPRPGSWRRRAPPASSILTHRRLLVDQFTRDLTKEGYGGRSTRPMLRGDPSPSTPPLTINTYSWFIKHAGRSAPTSTAWSSATRPTRRSARRRPPPSGRSREPVYIGMTATDQLLQKHVGDVFPAEVADFPLAEAVRRGVVAPLRCVRVRPIASLRQVEIVGGDFDQGQLAAALDLDPLNLAAADLYQSRFGDTPGHRLRRRRRPRRAGRGRDARDRHAAAAVSGRTPPRELAETLAAYERGEINVLVNAQILAEGWNAPRATVCMHLAPTASRRVYQQRVGQDHAPAPPQGGRHRGRLRRGRAPHSERAVTLHSLLDVDAYRPGGLVTPPPRAAGEAGASRREPIVKEAAWIVPVSDDPGAPGRRHREPVEATWMPRSCRSTSSGPGPSSPPAMTRAGRRAYADRADRGLQPEARELFFFTCAAENKPSQAAAARASAIWRPPAPARRRSRWPAGWSRRHPPGSRTAARAHGCCCSRWATARSRRRRPDRVVDVAARPGRARPRVPLRREPHPGRPQPAGRAGRREVRRASTAEAACGLRRSRATRRWRPGRRSWPWRLRGAARQGERLIESARRTLSEDPMRLAAALGSNIPAPVQRAKRARKTKRKAEKARRDGVVQRRRCRLHAAGEHRQARRSVSSRSRWRPQLPYACATTPTRCSRGRSAPSSGGGLQATARGRSRPPSRCGRCGRGGAARGRQSRSS